MVTLNFMYVQVFRLRRKSHSLLDDPRTVFMKILLPILRQLRALFTMNCACARACVCVCVFGSQGILMTNGISREKWYWIPALIA